MTLKNSPVADDLLATPITRTSARNLSDSGSPDTDFRTGLRLRTDVMKILTRL